MKQSILSNLLLFLFLIMVLPHSVYNQTPSKDTIAINEKIREKYTKIFKKYKVVGASIAIIDNGEVVFAEGFGYEDLAQNKRATINTVYGIGSISKSFTALAIMQLHEKGLLDIDEAIQKYIPELKIKNQLKENKPLYIKDIMSHLAGLPSDLYNGFIGNQTPDIHWVINELNKQNTIYPSQYTLTYSNVAYALLGELIERVSGMEYSIYLQKHIFSPLEMSSSGVDLLAPNLSKPYMDKEEAKPTDIRDHPAGAVTSSLMDMVNFTKLFLQNGTFKNQQILERAHLEAMEQNYNANSLLERSFGYGYGIIQTPLAVKNASLTTATLLGHGGDIEAFHGDFRYIPELNVGAIILTNTDKGAYVRNAAKVLKFYLKEAKGISIDISYQNAERGHIDHQANEILGHYNLGIGVLEVTDLEKIKFKMDGTRVVLKRKEKTASYSITAKLLGFIPIKIKQAEFKFVKKGNDIFLKEKNLKSNTGSYMAKKTQKTPIPKTWKSFYGNYQITNIIQSGIKGGRGFDNASANLAEENGNLVLTFIEGKQKEKFYLQTISEDRAVIGGIGRSRGDVVKILEDGKLYFSGFTFEKK